MSKLSVSCNNCG